MNNQEATTIFIDSIKTLVNKPNNLDNLESYLSQHFDQWLKKFANSPENMAVELKNFADMEI
jgi:hypothetical protein